jgi:3-(3-hydroxy-phenyl)propionate hydroxylase
MRTQTTEVLIVGAGPTGLTAALYLASRGVQVAIFDENAGRSQHSKAFGVQAGTLEVLKSVVDQEFASSFVKAGISTQEINFHIGHQKPLHVDFSMIPSEFNFVLILAQSETERLLEEKLATHGVTVQRHMELKSFKQDDMGVKAYLKSTNSLDATEGSDQLVVKASFLIGCDGAHSTVRHELGIAFDGSPYDGLFALGDVKIDWPWEHKGIHTFLSPNGVAACFPMDGTNRHRVILIPNTPPTAKPNLNLTLEELKERASLYFPEPVKLYDPEWLTYFRVHHRLASKFREGRAFLVGDAAHIHSPVGGQGMNTGMQDAVNLASKVKLVFKDKTDPALLDQYEIERRPIAKSVLRATDFAFRMALQKENWLTRFGKNWVLPAGLKQKWVQKRVARAVSEVDFARVEIARAKENGASGPSAVRN